MPDPKRADPFGDLSEFQPMPARKPAALVQKEAIREVSEANDFPSRAPERAKPVKPVAQRRRRTGRNVQMNIKATSETIARFTALADKHGLVFGELLDRALEAFERAGENA